MRYNQSNLSQNNDNQTIAIRDINDVQESVGERPDSYLVNNQISALDNVLTHDDNDPEKAGGKFAAPSAQEKRNEVVD